MTTTHVFIVDTTTFKYHLEYLFAGTGAKDNIIDFNNNPDTSLNHTTENNLVGMIADSQRVRKGDFVIFYLQQNYSVKVWEGKFYGIFKVKEDLSFLDNNDSNQFLKQELIKSLTFRTLLEPFEVYSKGVTEWEALDEIKYIQSPNQMLWSLIYRKLKGNRGNTMITIYESERLFKLLRDKNNRQILSGQKFTFNVQTQEINQYNTTHNYTGRKEKINILPRLIKKYKDNKAFETHLQAYIVQNIGRKTNISLDHSLLNGWTIEWLGNEVSCGVGMQRIDVMLSLVNGNIKIFGNWCR
jgi:predicted RNA-binding protein